MGFRSSDLSTTQRRSDRELERVILDAGADRTLVTLAEHWASTLRAGRRRHARPLRIQWRLTLPNGFYAVGASSEPGRATCEAAAFPGPPPIPADLTYQWYVLGLLRVMSGEHDMAHAYARRWVAVSGDTATWRAVRANPGTGVSLEARLHRWDDA